MQVGVDACERARQIEYGLAFNARDRDRKIHVARPVTLKRGENRLVKGRG